MVTDAQVRKLMSELSKHGEIGRASMKADMDRKTGRRYRDLGCVPSKEPGQRDWRTRADPFAEDWPELEAKLEVAPELEAKTLLVDLISRKPGQNDMSELRTLQRRVKTWLAKSGPEKRVYFAQDHRPGEVGHPGGVANTIQVVGRWIPSCWNGRRPQRDPRRSLAVAR